jgi:hypothetical protein
LIRFKTWSVKDKPGKHWSQNFRQRWSHRVKVPKPKNIKRSRAIISPKEVCEFFQRMRPNLEGICRGLRSVMTQEWRWWYEVF